MTNDELERQAFERWQRTLAGFKEFWLEIDRAGEYYCRSTNGEWRAWKARANLEKSDGKVN